MKKRRKIVGKFIFFFFLISLIFPSKIRGSQPPPQGVFPLIYNMFGSAHYRPPSNAGGVGAWTGFGWDMIQPQGPNSFDWSPIDSYLNSFVGKETTLKNGQKIRVPVGFSIDLITNACTNFNDTPKTCAGLHLPDWLIDEIGMQNIPYSAPNPQPACGKAYYPPWGNEIFQRRWAEMVQALGQRYDKDPRVNWVAISTGPYGEAIQTMYNGRKYRDNSGTEVACPRFSVGKDFKEWVLGDLQAEEFYKKGAVHIYRLAFPSQALFIINTGEETSRDLAQRALSVTPHVGIKMHSWHPDLPNQIRPGTMVNVFKWYNENCGNDCLTGLEHAYGENRPQTYWAMLFLITHQMTIADISREHIEALVKVEDCSIYTARGVNDDCYPMWELVEGHLGRNVFNVPDVLIVLRDTFYQTYSGDPLEDRRGEFGNWERFLYLIEGENFEAMPCSDLPPPYNEVNPQRIYGCWDLSNRFVARKVGGNRPSMDFRIDDRWPAKQTIGFDIEVTYIDKGNDTWKLEYKSASGELKRETVSKTNSGRFVRRRFTLPTASFISPISSTGNNFRINDGGDGEDYIHMVRVIPQNWQAPSWDFASANCPRGSLGNLDCDRAGKINEKDLNIMLVFWSPRGPVPSPPPGFHTADLNGDNKVDALDKLILFQNWLP